MTDIHCTKFEVVVYSRGPLDLASRDDDPFGLLAINYEINEGSCIGDVRELGDEVIARENVRAHLIAIGNDGEFFDDEDDVDEVIPAAVCGFCSAALTPDGTKHLPPYGEHEEPIIVIRENA